MANNHFTSEAAQDVLREAQGVERHQPSFGSAFHSAAMPARIAVEQRDWTQAMELEARDPDYFLMRSAAELEDRTEKHPITPGALLPPNEALGDLLMALDRPAEALAAYERSDDTWPGRFNTLLGAARAADAAGEESKAREYYDQVIEVAPDSPRQGLREAREFIGG